MINILADSVLKLPLHQLKLTSHDNNKCHLKRVLSLHWATWQGKLLYTRNPLATKAYYWLYIFPCFKGTSFEYRKPHALHTWREIHGTAYQVSRASIENWGPIKYQAYSALENHICWNDPRDARMLPPIQTLHMNSNISAMSFASSSRLFANNLLPPFQIIRCFGFL